MPSSLPTPGAAERRLAFALLFLSSAMFSGNVLMARWAAGEMPPLAMAFWRWAVVCLVLLPAIHNDLRRAWPAFRAEAGDMFILGALAMGMCAAFPYIAGQTTTATNIALVYSAAPVLIAIAGVFVLGERLGPMQALGVVLAAAGILGIVAKGDVDTLLNLQFVPGDLWTLGAALAWAAYSLLLRKRRSALPALLRLWGFALGGALSLLPFTIWEGVAVTAPTLDWTTVAIVLFLALVPGIGAFRLHQHTTKVLGAARTGMTTYLMPLFAAGFAWMLLGEAPAAYHYAGGALVLVGVWLAGRTSSRP